MESQYIAGLEDPRNVQLSESLYTGLAGNHHVDAIYKSRVEEMRPGCVANIIEGARVDQARQAEKTAGSFSTLMSIV